MIPVEDDHTISFTVSQVTWQIMSQSCPEQRRNSSGGRKMILVDVIKNFIIYRISCLVFSDYIFNTIPKEIKSSISDSVIPFLAEVTKARL